MEAADISYPVLVVSQDPPSVWFGSNKSSLGLCSAANPGAFQDFTLIDSEGRHFEVGPVTRLHLDGDFANRARQILIHCRYADFEVTQVGTLDWPAIQALVIRLEEQDLEPEANNPDYEDVEPDQTPLARLEQVRTGVQEAKKIEDLSGLIYEVPDSMYVGTAGRASRMEYWILLAAHGAWLSLGAVIAGTLYLLGAMARHALGDHFVAGLILWLFGTFCVLSVVASVRSLGNTLVRRLKDLNTSGGWILLGLLAAAVTWTAIAQTTSSVWMGLWAGLGTVFAGLIGLGVLPGSRGDNKYGPKSLF